MTTLLGLILALSPLIHAEPCEKQLLKAVMSDVMLRGALAEARASGGRCVGTVQSSIDNGAGGTDVEVDVTCSRAGDDVTGGGAFLMINVKGRVFGDGLENSVIRVQRAG